MTGRIGEENANPNPQLSQALRHFEERTAPSEKPAERVVKRVVQSIESKREAGKLDGYDIAVEFYQGILVLKGEIADADAQSGVIASARGQVGVFCICNALKIAKAGDGLSNKTTTTVAPIEQLKIPSGATWLSNEPTQANVPLRWDDGYWQVDFELDVF